MFAIELTRRRIAAASILIVVTLLVAGNYLANRLRGSAGNSPNCVITPPAAQTMLIPELTHLPSIATTDLAPELEINHKLTAYLLTCDGHYERRLYPAYQEGQLPSELAGEGYLVAVLTAEATIPYPTPQTSVTFEAYPP